MEYLASELRPELTYPSRQLVGNVCRDDVVSQDLPAVVIHRRVVYQVKVVRALMNSVERRYRDGRTMPIVNRNAHSFMDQIGHRGEHLRDHAGELVQFVRRQPHFHAGRFEADEVCEIIGEKLHSRRTQRIERIKQLVIELLEQKAQLHPDEEARPPQLAASLLQTLAIILFGYSPILTPCDLI